MRRMGGGQIRGGQIRGEMAGKETAAAPQSSGRIPPEGLSRLRLRKKQWLLSGQQLLGSPSYSGQEAFQAGDSTKRMP